jgi:ABC-type sugar transport system ATPase subunit
VALSTPAFHGAMLIGTFGFMVYANPWMALVAMVLFPIQMFFIRRLQKKGHPRCPASACAWFAACPTASRSQVGGLQEIYANDTVAYESNRYRHLLQRIFKIRLNIYNLKYLIKWINNFLEKFGQFLLLLVGGWLIIHHPESFNLGILVAFLQAYGQLNEPWRELINFFQLKENARVKYEQVIANFDPPDLRAEFRGTTPPGASDGPVRGLRPPPGQRRAGRADPGAGPNVQLSLSPHEHVALVGTAGSGKSTLALVLAKLTNFTGTVLLDGSDLAQLTPGLAGRAIGFVPTDARLFTGSVLDNLLYGLRHRRGQGAEREPELGLGGEDWLDLGPARGVGPAGARRGGARRGAAGGAGGRPLRLRAARASRSRAAPGDRRAGPRHPPPARHAVRGEQQETAVEFFDRDRFSSYASIGENILFGHSSHSSLSLDHLAQHPHFRAVIAEVELEGALGRARRRRRPGTWSRSSRTSRRTTSCSPASACSPRASCRSTRRSWRALGRDASNIAPADRDRPDPAGAPPDSRPAPPRPDRRRVHRQGAGGAPPVRRGERCRSPSGRRSWRTTASATFADGSLLDKPALRQGGRHEQPGREEGERNRGGGCSTVRG